MEGELELCPFCGSIPDSSKSPIDRGEWGTGCINHRCSVNPMAWAPTQQVSEKMWNIRASDWRPITPESLPKVGDEALGYDLLGCDVYPVDSVPESERVFSVWHDWGYKYYRPINPPTGSEETKA